MFDVGERMLELIEKEFGALERPPGGDEQWFPGNRDMMTDARREIVAAPRWQDIPDAALAHEHGIQAHAPRAVLKYMLPAMMSAWARDPNRTDAHEIVCDFGWL